MDELWQKAASMRQKALETGNHRDWVKAWAAQAEAERKDTETKGPCRLAAEDTGFSSRESRVRIPPGVSDLQERIIRVGDGIDQVETEVHELEMSPAKAYYSKDIHGKPAAGALPEERPRRRRKEGAHMPKKNQNQEGAVETKKRPKGAALVEKRTSVVLTGLVKLSKTRVDMLSQARYDELLETINAAVKTAKAAMDEARVPKETPEKIVVNFQFTKA